MPEFRMPSLGADMDAGTVVEWLVKPGDEVHRGDIVAVVDTDKADVDVEIFDDGVVDEILVPPGKRVDVGTPLATITAPGETAANRPAAAKKPPAKKAPSAQRAPSAKKPPAKKPAAKRKPPARRAPKRSPGARPAEAKRPEPPAEETPHSPVIRRLAHHLGVDLASVTGTGPNGAVTRADVERAATGASAETRVSWAAPSAPEQPAEAAERPDRQAGMRQAIAALMARSKREIPHYYLGTHVDVTNALGWLERANLERPVPERLLPAVLFLKAVALAARDVPDLNGFWIDDRFRPGDGVHLGVAISLRTGGLIAPAIHEADTKDLTTLMDDLRDLVNRSRAGRLRSSEMSDPTLTVTNLGDQGVETVYGVIYPPQVALVGMGKVVDRPWAADDMIGVRRVLSLTLAADHRASDGHTGARFLAAVEQHLQEPEQL